jgi:hypothetical protein
LACLTSSFPELVLCSTHPQSMDTENFAKMGRWNPGSETSTLLKLKSAVDCQT